MNAWVVDFRHALRSLIKAPGFTLTAVAILALGLGLSMYMFGAINAYIFKPLPYPDAHELVHLELSRPAKGDSSISLTVHDFLDFRREQRSLESLAGFYVGTVNIGGDDYPERFDGAFVTANTFDVIGVGPALGRTFLPGEDEPGAAPVVLLGHNLWLYRYGGDPEVIGRTVRVNGHEAVVIGVVPPGFRFPFNEDVWIPLSLDTRDFVRGEGYGMDVLGRPRLGVTLDEARAEYQAIADRLGELYPETNEGIKVVLKPYREEFVDDGTRMSMLTMFGTVFLVLLIACANVANLLVARNAARMGELSIRTALGASRPRLIGYVLTECLVISFLGGTLATVVARWSGDYTIKIMREVDTLAPPFWASFAPDWRSWSFAFLAAVVAAIAAGIGPALKASRADVNAALRQGGQNVAGNPHARMTRFLVTAQITLSAVVLIGGGLMARSVIALQGADLGADTEGVFTSRVGLFPTDYPEPSDRLRFYETLQKRLSALPEVEAVTLSTSLPGSIVGYREVVPEGLDPDENRRFAQVVTVTPNYFELFGVEVFDGRPLWETDRSDSLPVAIVNKRFVERYWAQESPIGKRIQFGRDSANPWITIVGIVPDIVQGRVNRPPRPAVYLPLAQDPQQFMSLAIHPRGGDPMALTEPVRKTVLTIDRDLPLYWVRTLEDWIQMGRFLTHFLASLFVLFAMLGLVLGGVGQYALTAYTVSLRAREIGVRRALGASDGSVLGLLLRQSMRHLVIGLSVGLVLSLGFARLLSSMLFGVEPFDPTTFTVVSIVLIATAALAALMPARRALAVDPIIVLRYE
jgi:putative ABC transport system permease protein